MDWSKAKNILIIAFMITNVFLIYHIEKDIFDHHTVVMLKENHVQNVVHILEEKKYKNRSTNTSEYAGASYSLCRIHDL